MPSLRHELFAVVIPRVRKSAELDSAEAERGRLERAHAAAGPLADRPLPTNAVRGLGKRYDHAVEHHGETRFPVHVLTPRGRTPRRTVVWMHGGGFVAGIDGLHVRYAVRLAERLDARVVVPDYPLAPEHTWADSHDALVELTARWAGEGPLLLGGDSAGGGIASAVALALRDRDLPRPEALLLLAPWVDLTGSTPATRWYAARDPWLRWSKLDLYASWWAGSDDDLGRPEVSPALADLHDLPPALVFCGTRDLLLPGCRLLARRAGEAGWDLDLVEAPGLIHVYPLLPVIPEADRAWERTTAFLAGAFGG